jgi:transposase InsO family protein
MAKVAARLGVPHSTARDWRRRHRARAPTLVTGFAALRVELGDEVIGLPEDQEQAALAVLGAAWAPWQAAVRLWGLRQSGERQGLAGHQHDPALGSAERSAFHGSDAIQLHPGGPVLPADPAETSALSRYAVIAGALNPRLGAKERGRLVREIAARVNTRPDGTPERVGRPTVDRWLRAYRKDSLKGLEPQRRSDRGAARRHPELFLEAAALRRELPARSADILVARHGIQVAPRTIRDQLRRQGLERGALGAAPVVYGGYEAERPNERWTGDVLSGPFVPHPRVAASRKAKLFLLVDDHSRLLVHGRWMSDENTRAGQTVLRAAVTRRGLPDQLYLDNGAPFAAAALERTCAVLGIRLVHSRPYSP